MKINNKEQALGELQKYSQIPNQGTAGARKAYWKGLIECAKEITKAYDDFRSVEQDLWVLWRNENDNALKKISGRRSELDIGAEVIREQGEAVADWLNMAIAVVSDFDDSDIESETETVLTTTKAAAHGSWAYIADGENAFIKINDTLVPITDPKQQRGNNQKVQLVDLLSFPDRTKKTVLKEEFDERLKSFGETLVAESAFVNAARAINKDVAKHFPDPFLDFDSKKCWVSNVYAE